MELKLGLHTLLIFSLMPFTYEVPWWKAHTLFKEGILCGT